jgi:hypothetical protein
MRLRSYADDLDLMISRVDDHEIERIAERLGLGTERGPHRLRASSPSSDSGTQAAIQAAQSIGPLTTALAALGALTFGAGWTTHKPMSETPEGAGIGLPLLGMCSTESVVAATSMLVARQLPKFAPVHTSLDVRLTHFLGFESLLWDLSAEYGGPTPRLPFAYRYRAIEWFWSPDTHRHRDAVAICLRCGDQYHPHRPPKADSEPRCPWCAKEPPKARRWPKHAVAPAERGTWWLRCQAPDCATPFRGRAQARHCRECSTAGTTPSQRRRLGD